MTEIKLKRTGQVPVTFTGELIQEGSSWQSRGDGQNRWHGVAIYRTEKSQRYVLAITFHSRWQGESELHDVLILDTDQKSTITALQEYDPIPGNIGYPNSAQYHERQERMEKDLRQRFRVLIAEILHDAYGIEERIE